MNHPNHRPETAAEARWPGGPVARWHAVVATHGPIELYYDSFGSVDDPRVSPVEQRVPRDVMSRRIQLSRRRGWRKPVGTVMVSRPTRWGNPFPIGPDCTQAESVRRYAEALAAGTLGFDTDDVRRELAGHDLACWCPLDEPCHADVLLAVANDPGDGDPTATADRVLRPAEG
jgi:hypothetical protein